MLLPPEPVRLLGELVVHLGVLDRTLGLLEQQALVDHAASGPVSRACSALRREVVERGLPPHALFADGRNQLTQGDDLVADLRGGQAGLMPGGGDRLVAWRRPSASGARSGGSGHRGARWRAGRCSWTTSDAAVRCTTPSAAGPVEGTGSSGGRSATWTAPAACPEPPGRLSADGGPSSGGDEGAAAGGASIGPAGAGASAPPVGAGAAGESAGARRRAPAMAGRRPGSPVRPTSPWRAPCRWRASRQRRASRPASCRAAAAARA